MKSILILCFICFALCDKRGPAYNLKHPDSTTSCMTAGLSEPNGVSDCVDSLLWVKQNNRYYDRCCFIRYQSNGIMHSSCASLTEEQYLDIAETMSFVEQKYGDNKIKVYQLDCSSSYFKIASIASVLLALLL